MGKTTGVSAFFRLTLMTFAATGALAVGCGGDDGDGGTASGSATGSATGTNAGTGTGTNSGTGSGSASGTGSGTGGGMVTCEPNPDDPCEVCAELVCNSQAQTCCAETGCLELVRCVFDTGCASGGNPLACYDDKACMTEIDAAGGLNGSGTLAAGELGDCLVAAVTDGSEDSCVQCGQSMQ